MTNNDKQKLAIGVVAAVLVIGALHFLFFSKSAATFKNALNDYNGKASLVQNQGRPKTKLDIFQFDYETINMKQQYYQMLLDSGIAGPMELVKETKSEDEFKQWVKECYLMMYKNFCAKWLARGDDTELTKLEFLTTGNGGWFLLRELPPSVREGQKAVSDLLRDLKDTDSLIKETSEDTPLYFQTTEKYRFQLYQFGLDLNYREALRENLGPLSAAMYTINRVDLVRQAVGKGEVGITDDVAYDLFLLDLFRFEDYEMNFINSYRQLRAVDDAITLADKHKLTNVTYLKTWEETNLNWPTLEERTKTEDPAAAASGVGLDFALDGIDPAMMFDEFADEGGRGGKGGRAGVVDAGAVGAESTKKDEFKVAATIPYEIRVLGSNSGVQSFLYEISQSKRYYSVDKLEFFAVPQEQNTIRANAVINVVSYYMKELVTEAQVKEQIELLQKQKNWLASKGIQTGDFVADQTNAQAPDYGSPRFTAGEI